ncbi:MAG: hypothetical protein RLZZ126_1884 [Pseudomonadota bacterium]|jgi:branched-chain amino acid transport system ATP-binding protein
MSATLSVRQLAKHFDGVQALKGVDFDVQGGECVALIGPNGAGKSTCFACIAGQHEPTSGSIEWQGQAVNHWSPARRLQAGMARTFQVAQTFEALTVLQNVKLILSVPHGISPCKSLDSADSGPAMALLAQVGLAQVAGQAVASLPYGMRKRLELAMALGGVVRPGQLDAALDGALLLLDEPAAGLAAAERSEVIQLVQRLSRQGLAVLYTEHNMDAVFGVADRVLVLMDGKLAAQGQPDDVARNDMVLRRYLGAGFRA